MGQGYKHVPQGIPRFVAETKDLRKQLDSQRTAANLNNSAITSGTGLTVGPLGGPQIQFYEGSDGQSRIAFLSPTDPTFGSVIEAVEGLPANALVIASPGVIEDAGFDVNSSQIVLGTGSTPAIGPSVRLTAGGAELQMWAFGGPSGSPSFVEIGNFFFYQFASGDDQFVSNASSLVFPSGIAEVRIRDSTNSAYVPIRASAFTVTSTVEAKQDVRSLGWDPVQVVRDAQAKRWRYKPEHADPDRVHFGPMVEDLPEELVDRTDPDEPSLSISDLLGVAWAAIGSLAARVEELERAAAQRDA